MSFEDEYYEHIPLEVEERLEQAEIKREKQQQRESRLALIEARLTAIEVKLRGAPK